MPGRVWACLVGLYKEASGPRQLTLCVSFHQSTCPIDSQLSQPAFVFFVCYNPEEEPVARNVGFTAHPIEFFICISFISFSFIYINYIKTYFISFIYINNNYIN